MDIAKKDGAVGFNLSVIAGGKTGPALDASTCALQGFLINYRYRGGKPRIYWPFGVAADLQSPRLWNQAFIDAWTAGAQQFWNFLPSTQAGTNFDAHYSVHFYSGPLPNTDTGSYVPKNVPMLDQTPATHLVTNYSYNPVPANQKRRMQ
jgi:hypothetical protein